MFLMALTACSNAQAPPPPALKPTSAPAPAAAPAPTAAAALGPESYSALLREDDQTWCAYKSPTDFKAKAESVKPTDSARVTFTADKLTELTYQIEAESGDWVLVDKYTLNDGGAVLRRANLLAQANLQVIQETSIRGGKADPLHVISVSTLDGKKAELSPDVDLPEVPVKTDLLAIPPVQVVAQLRSQAVGELCRKMNGN
jgi:hypothetical protein